MEWANGVRQINLINAATSSFKFRFVLIHSINEAKKLASVISFDLMKAEWNGGNKFKKTKFPDWLLALLNGMKLNFSKLNSWLIAGASNPIINLFLKLVWIPIQQAAKPIPVTFESIAQSITEFRFQLNAAFHAPKHPAAFEFRNSGLMAIDQTYLRYAGFKY